MPLAQESQTNTRRGRPSRATIRIPQDAQDAHGRASRDLDIAVSVFAPSEVEAEGSQNASLSIGYQLAASIRDPWNRRTRRPPLGTLRDPAKGGRRDSRTIWSIDRMSASARCGPMRRIAPRTSGSRCHTAHAAPFHTGTGPIDMRRLPDRNRLAYWQHLCSDLYEVRMRDRRQGSMRH